MAHSPTTRLSIQHPHPTEAEETATAGATAGEETRLQSLKGCAQNDDENTGGEGGRRRRECGEKGGFHSPPPSLPPALSSFPPGLSLSLSPGGGGGGLGTLQESLGPSSEGLARAPFRVPPSSHPPSLPTLVRLFFPRSWWCRRRRRWCGVGAPCSIWGV